MIPRSARKGFTLIEILIVVAIIGLLASVVLVGLAPAQRRGRDSRRLADLKETQNALELYYNKCGHYPGTEDCAVAAGAPADWAGLTTALTKASIGVSQIPSDPSAGKDYAYYTNASRNAYLLTAGLEDANNPVLNKQPAGSDVAGFGFNGTCGKGETNTYCVLF